MATSDIITGQFVKIEQTPATIADRLVARIVDTAFICAYSIAMMYLLSVVNTTLMSLDVSDLMITISFLILTMPVWLYNFLCESMFNGQTIGKNVMKIRVVMADGSSPTLGALFLRWLLQTIDIGFAMIGLVFIILNKKGQRIGDMAAGTMVIRRPEQSTMHFSLSEYGYLRRNYVPLYPEAQNLSLNQAELICKVVKETAASPLLYASPRMELLAQKVEKVLGIQRRQDTLSFLHTIANDYQYFALQII